MRNAMMIGVSALSLVSPLAWGGQEYVSLRVISHNVEFGLDAQGSSTYEAVADMITIVDDDPNDGATGLMPDVVCFQELATNEGSILTTFRNARLPGYTMYAPTSEGDGFLYQGILVRGDINVLQTGSINTVNPRDPIFVVIEVPGSDEVVKIYCTHLKAGNSSSDQDTRELQANVLGAAIENDIANGFVAGVPIEKQRVILAGDLNSNDRADGSIEGIFAATSTFQCCAPEDGSADADFLSLLGVDCSTMSPCCVPDISAGLCNAVGGTLEQVFDRSGLLDIRYESILASTQGGESQIGTRQPTETRLDYVAADETLALRRDTNGNGSLDPTETGAGGFIYRSEQNVPGFHTPGQFANGNSNAVAQAADHRPVVADFLFTVPVPTGGCCIEGECFVLTETNCLAMLGTYLGDGSDCTGDPCAPVNDCFYDTNNDGTVDIIDFGAFGTAFGSMLGDPNYVASLDSNDDDTIDIIDFGLFGMEFNRTDCLD